MDATLVIIGLDFHTSPIAVRERFWIPENEQIESLQTLVRSEGIEEAVILTTCGRTEFILWASDPTEGANSVLRFLTRKFDLKLSDWSNFYRLLDNAALLHLFRVAAGLDSMALGHASLSSQLTHAWQIARRADTVGRFLDLIMQKAASLTSLAPELTAKTLPPSVLDACLDYCTEILGPLGERSVLILGAGQAATWASKAFRAAGATNFTVLGRGKDRTESFAAQSSARVIDRSQLRQALTSADVVIAATSSPTFVVGCAELAATLRSRQRLPLVLVDLALPRNIDPDVRTLTGIFLYGLDDLEQATHRASVGFTSGRTEIENMLAHEVHGFRAHLLAEQDLPTVIALRRRLEEICGQELRSLEDQFGPFTEDQQHALHSLASHITQRIAGGVARKLKELPEPAEQEQLTEAMRRLFHLQTSQRIPPAQRN